MGLFTRPTSICRGKTTSAMTQTDTDAKAIKQLFKLLGKNCDDTNRAQFNTEFAKLSQNAQASIKSELTVKVAIKTSDSTSTMGKKLNWKKCITALYASASSNQPTPTTQETPEPSTSTETTAKAKPSKATKKTKIRKSKEPVESSSSSDSSSSVEASGSDTSSSSSGSSSSSDSDNPFDDIDTAVKGMRFPNKYTSQASEPIHDFKDAWRINGINAVAVSAAPGKDDAKSTKDRRFSRPSVETLVSVLDYDTETIVVDLRDPQSVSDGNANKSKSKGRAYAQFSKSKNTKNREKGFQIGFVDGANATVYNFTEWKDHQGLGEDEQELMGKFIKMIYKKSQGKFLHVHCNAGQHRTAAFLFGLKVYAKFKHASNESATLPKKIKKLKTANKPDKSKLKKYKKALKEHQEMMSNSVAEYFEGFIERASKLLETRRGFGREPKQIQTVLWAVHDQLVREGILEES